MKTAMVSRVEKRGAVKSCFFPSVPPFSHSPASLGFHSSSSVWQHNGSRLLLTAGYCLLTQFAMSREQGHVRHTSTSPMRMETKA